LKIFTGSEDTTIRVYDLKTSNLISSFEGHFSTITSFQFINNDSYLLSSSRDNVVIVWNLTNLQSIINPFKTIPIYEVCLDFKIIFLPRPIRCIVYSWLLVSMSFQWLTTGTLL
jgi:WD40 repeat protein